MGVLKDIIAPYTSLEAWMYDTFIVPGIMEHQAAFDEFLLPLAKEGSLLDVGCGGGQLAIQFATKRPELQVAGIDLSPHQVERAIKRAQSFGDRVRFTQGSALELPFHDSSFDGVMSVLSIKHWTDQRQGIAECVRVLKPGGKLAIIEADRGCRFEDAQNFIRRWRVFPPLRPIALFLFRTLMAGRSIDLIDASTLLEPLPLSEREVRRIDGTPALVMLARKTQLSNDTSGSAG